MVDVRRLTVVTDRPAPEDLGDVDVLEVQFNDGLGPTVRFEAAAASRDDLVLRPWKREDADD